MERKLIYVPMMHDLLAGEMGSFGAGLEKILPLVNLDLKLQYCQEQDNYWDKVKKYLANHKINRVYQDSYPVTPRPFDFSKEILTEDNIKRSRFYRMIHNLSENGSILMPTESPDLLLLEIKHSKDRRKMTIYEKRKNFLEDLKLSFELISKRDQYIADNIAQTLQDNETGVLFMGIDHKTDKVIKDKYPGITVYGLPVDMTRLIYLTNKLCIEASSPEEKDLIELKDQYLNRH